MSTIDTSRSRTRRIKFIIIVFNFLHNCKQLGVYPKFLIFKHLNVSNKDALSIYKRRLRSAINKHNKELNISQKILVNSKPFYPNCYLHLSIYIFKRFIASQNKKSLQKKLNTQQKKMTSLTRNCSLPTFRANETILTSRNMSYPKKNPIY